MHHGQHGLELTAQIAAGTPSTRRRRLQERGDLRPGGLAERGRAGHEEDWNRPRCRGTGLCRRWTVRPALAMPMTSDRLVVAAPQRPAQVVVTLGVLGLG
jgi:hypothetical protein